jgi:hypothetical protein
MQHYIRLITGQIVKCGPDQGGPLPRMESPGIARTFRSKYERHVGHKQRVKMLKRPENELALLA